MAAQNKKSSMKTQDALKNHHILTGYEYRQAPRMSQGENRYNGSQGRITAGPGSISMRVLSGIKNHGGCKPCVCLLHAQAVVGNRLDQGLQIMPAGVIILAGCAG